MLVTSRSQELNVLGWLCHGAGVLSLGVVGFAAHCFVLRPLAEQERRATASIELLQVKLQDADEIRAEHTRLSRSLEEIKRRAEEVRERIPDQPREAEFLTQMSNLSADHGVTIMSFRRGTAASNDNHSRLTMLVRIEANYYGICGFLDSLARLPRVTTIEKLVLDAETTNERYPVDMTIVLYYGIQTVGHEKGKFAIAST